MPAESCNRDHFLTNTAQTLEVVLSFKSFHKKAKAEPTMNAQITQQNRENAAQQFRQWAMAKNVSLAQTEQMVTALLSGQHDAQILRAAQSAGSGHQQQHHDFVHMAPTFGFQTPFGTFPLPAMPPPPIPMAPGVCPPPPPLVVPNMFPTHGVQVDQQIPNVQTTRTTFPGGEAVQQSSSYAGQQGNTNFQYSSSSTSMSFSPAPQLPAHPIPLPSVQYVQQPILPGISHPPPTLAPVHAAPPPQPQPQPQSQPQQPLKPHPQLVPVPAPIVQVAPEPEQIFHPITANQAPQNSRLAETFKRELSEATYFSDIPGMPDRSAQK